MKQKATEWGIILAGMSGLTVVAYLSDHGTRSQSVAILGYAFAYIVGICAGVSVSKQK